MAFFIAASAFALDRPETTFKVFQFPADRIPRIDGKADDWNDVPADYVVGTDLLTDDSGKHAKPDPNNLDVRMRVGWVKGLNRLYFLYEATDNYWDFARPDLHNDTFEIVVDGDASGGPLVDHAQQKVWTPDAVGKERVALDKRISPAEEHWAFHGAHAQNYHIFTPAKDKDWCMVFGSATWIKELPYANAAYSYNFKPGEPGRLTLEFWITPFDYAGAEGPQRAVESTLFENKILGLSWAIIDFDGQEEKDGFWNLSRKHTMYGDASQLCAFKLMPLEEKFRKKIESRWSFKVVDAERRLVAFKDESEGKVTSWRWDFGDGETSTERNPIHQYKTNGEGMITVILDVEGPEGKSRRSKVWDVQLK